LGVISRGVHPKRAHNEFVFATHTEPESAGHQNLDPRSNGEHSSSERRCGHHVLEVVKHQQLVFGCKMVADLIDERAATRLA
jgi:hypothetical protein